MVVRINELNVKTEKPPPPAFQGKSIEDVVVGLIGQVNQLTAKLKDARDRIRELETDVTKLTSLTQGLPQMVNQQGAKLSEHDTMLSNHDWSLEKLHAVFQVDLFTGSWSGTLGPQDFKVVIKAKELKIESLSTLKMKSSTATEIRTGGPLSLDTSGSFSVDSVGDMAMSGNKLTLSAGMLTVNSGHVSFSKFVKCETLQAISVIASNYTPGNGNIW